MTMTCLKNWGPFRGPGSSVSLCDVVLDLFRVGNAVLDFVNSESLFDYRFTLTVTNEFLKVVHD